MRGYAYSSNNISSCKCLMALNLAVIPNGSRVPLGGVSNTQAAGFDSPTRWMPQRGDLQMRRVHAQLPCVIVTYIPGKDLVAAKIGIGRKGCSKRPICTQLRRPQMYKTESICVTEMVSPRHKLNLG